MSLMPQEQCVSPSLLNTQMLLLTFCLYSTSDARGSSGLGGMDKLPFVMSQHHQEPHVSLKKNPDFPQK
jgi:hypothetical protein